MSYTDLKKLDFNTAIKWLHYDARDDFFPDPLRYIDIKQYSSDFLERTKHSLLNHRLQPPECFEVPKANFLIRDAISLKPQARIIYLALLQKIAPYINPIIPSTTYSYRIPNNCNIDKGEYPFYTKQSIGQWHEFINDFRRLSLSEDCEYIIITDIANFFNHIRIDKFIEQLRTITAQNNAEKELNPYLSELKDLLDSFTTTGYGIPQNYDPSSFFASAYLSSLDLTMQREGYRFFRYVDDIRIVASSKGEVRESLYRLQKLARDLGMYLSSAKTKIFQKGTPEFKKVLDVADDQMLSNYEEILKRQDVQEIGSEIPALFERLEYHDKHSHDDRKFRAFANKLLETAKFPNFFDEILPKLKGYALENLKTHPERSDKWASLISPDVDEDVQKNLLALLKNDNYRAISWQRMWIFETLLRASELKTSACIDEARRVSDNDRCSFVKGRALLLRGKFGDNIERDRIASDYFMMNAPIDIKRAVVIAIQELDEERRNSHYKRFLRIDQNVKELVHYVKESDKIRYSTYSFKKRKLSPQPKKINILAKRGFGLINNKTTNFRLPLTDAEYI